MIEKGLLVRWNDDRGFGFIKPSSGGEDIFIHISALKHLHRRPVVGDVINYQANIDGNGKMKAVNANIEGVKNHRYHNRSVSQKRTMHPMSLIISLIALAGLSFLHYQTNSVRYRGVENDAVGTEVFSRFSCEGKQYCSEMESCEEARFYLKNCPDVKIDGDHDGIPCESQWCSSRASGRSI